MVLVNGVNFSSEEFHNGEVIFKKPEFISLDRNVIEMYFQNNKDITAVLFARQYLTDVSLGVPCDLVMKYCPYERMDREINNQMFSMKYFAEILGKFDFDTVYILDPHSDVCVDLLGDVGLKVKIISLEDYVQQVIDDFKPDYICYPDKGAYHKYPKVLSNIKIPFFFGEKKRDLENKGRITDYELIGAPDLKDKKALIIDDICCLGGTAYNAATEMKKLGAKEVAFYISHCENGVFAGKILEKRPLILNGKETHFTGEDYIIDKVYTADTMLVNQKHENLHIVKSKNIQ